MGARQPEGRHPSDALSGLLEGARSARAIPCARCQHSDGRRGAVWASLNSHLHTGVRSANLPRSPHSLNLKLAEPSMEQPFGPSEISSNGGSIDNFKEASLQWSYEVSESPQPLQSLAPGLARRYHSPIRSPQPGTRPTVRRRDPAGPALAPAMARAGALSGDLARAAPSEALGRTRLAPPVTVANSKGACFTSVARAAATPWVGSEPS